MKAKDFLYWCIDFQVNMETSIGKIDIEEDSEDFSQEDYLETFFGVKPYKKIPCGEYVYLWDDVLEPLTESGKEIILKNFEIRLNNDGNYIYLIRIED